MTIEKQIYRSGPFKDFYAQAVRSGNTLYLAGQVGVDQHGQAGLDIVEQTRLAYKNIQQVLENFDADMDNIIDETLFVTDMSELRDNLEPVFSNRAMAYGKPPEVCQTVVEVKSLVMPELKIEIKCVAMLQETSI